MLRTHMHLRTRRALALLAAASLIGGLAQSVAGSAAALLAARLGGSDAVAGLPQALLVVGSAIAALGLSALTRRYGRGRALAAGTVTAAAGCALVLAAAVAGSLPWVLAGSVALGAGNTAVMLGRYAAADLAAEAARARAMASVLVATTVGAVAGPNLLAPAAVVGDALGLPPFGGAYLLGGVAFVLAAALLRRLPRASAEKDSRRNLSAESPTRLAAVGSSGALGLGVLALTNVVMVGVMTMAPVHLHHMGIGLAMIGLVISLHIAGMFAPAPLSGWLTDRVGGRAAAVVAGVLLAASGVLAAAGAESLPLLVVALVLLGVGWNVGLIAGSALLTAGVPADERPRREGWGEVGMGVAAAGGGATSGLLVGAGGYALLAVTGAVIAAGLIPLALRFTWWRSGQQRVPAPSPPPPHGSSVAR